MSYYKFGIDDIFYNTIETYPQYTVQVYDTNIYINGETNRKGAQGGAGAFAGAKITIVDVNLLERGDIIRLVATDTTVVTVTAAKKTTNHDTNSPSFFIHPGQPERTTSKIKQCINANSKFTVNWPRPNSDINILEIIQTTAGSAGDTAIQLTLANAGSITKNDFSGGGNKPDIKSVSQGEISLYELNIDRPATKRIYPFINKQGARAAFKTVSDTSFDNTDIFDHGDQINGIYPLSASITRIYVDEGTDVSSYTFRDVDDSSFTAAAKNKKYIRSLKPTLKNYINLSKHYAYDADQIVGVKGATSTITQLEAGFAYNATAIITFTGVPTLNQTITIISADGTSKGYIAKNTENLTEEPPQFDRSGTTAETVDSLQNCIEAAEGHKDRITVTQDSTGLILTLTQVVAGTDGNTTVTENLTNVSVKGGDNTSNKFTPPSGYLHEKTIIFNDAESNTHTITFDKSADQADSSKTIAGIKDKNTTAGALTSLKKSLDLAITDGEINMSTSALVDSKMVVTMTSNKEAGDGKTITGTAISYSNTSATTFSGASFKEGENKGTQVINMICIPSIFYGSSIKRGSVNLKFNVTGSTIAELSDKNKNGELIQASGSAHAATAVDAIDTSGLGAAVTAGTDCLFKFNITTAAGGEGGDITFVLNDNDSTGDAQSGADTISIGAPSTNDATWRAHIIDAINGTANNNVTFATGGRGTAGVEGITAANGTAADKITLTMDTVGVAGNISSALADLSGHDIVDVTAFTGGTTNKNDSVAGVVLYNEGIIMLTGSWAIAPHTEAYILDTPTLNPKWIYFGSGMKSVGTDHTAIAASGLNNSSFEFSFEGVNPIPTITMMAHARAGELNYSNNPTFLQHGTSTTSSYGRMAYMEVPAKIKNTVKSKFTNHTASFKKQTYISKIGIYDENRNLIAIANIANPLKKEEEKEYTFKMKLDF